MKSKYVMVELEIIVDYLQDLKYTEDEISYLSLDPKKKISCEDIINQLKENVKDRNKDIEYHFERISEILGFEIKKFDIQSIYSELEIITQEEQNLNDMCAALDSEDPWSMACNDPGLQFEQGEVLIKSFLVSKTDIESERKKSLNKVETAYFGRSGGGFVE